MTNDIFIREDLTKLENRINVSLFGLMAVDSVREWLLGKLELPTAAVVYPPMNLATETGSGRPDFVVRDPETNAVLAWIEVECWSNREQLAAYRRTYSERVIALWGKPGPECELSLQEVGAFLDAKLSAQSPQVRVSFAHLRGLIREIDDNGGSRASRTAAVGVEMKRSRLLMDLADVLGAKLYYFMEGEGPMPAGRIRVDTTDTADNRGYSIGVYSPNTPKRRVSIMNRSGGRPAISFSSKAWLYYYLPGHRSLIDEWCDFAWKMGADLAAADPLTNLGDRPRGNRTVAVPITIAEEAATQIAEYLGRMAERAVS